MRDLKTLLRILPTAFLDFLFSHLVESLNNHYGLHRLLIGFELKPQKCSLRLADFSFLKNRGFACKSWCKIESKTNYEGLERNPMTKEDG